MRPGPVSRLLTRLGELTSRPAAFVIVAVYAGVWAVIEPTTLDMHGIATLVTWFMTLFIQRAAHRDTQAIHAKLDEVLRGHGETRSELADLDDKEPEEIERHRQDERR